MTKGCELAEPSSCLNRSRDDEPIFVLCARDVSAPGVVLAWIETAQALGVEPAKIAAAESCHAAMIAWQKGNADAVKRPD